jgi:hypothetical protein
MDHWPHEKFFLLCQNGFSERMKMGSKPQILSVGSQYMGPVPYGEGAVLTVHNDGSMLVTVVMPHPSPLEVAALEGPWEWRIYEGPDMPGGLLMFCGRMKNGKRLCFELAFDSTLEASERLEGVIRRIANPENKENPNLVARVDAIVVDPLEGNRIVVLKVMGPPATMLERLAILWAAQPGQGSYDKAYNALSQRMSPEDIWKKAKPYFA